MQCGKYALLKLNKFFLRSKQEYSEKTIIFHLTSPTSTNKKNLVISKDNLKEILNEIVWLQRLLHKTRALNLLQPKPFF